MRERVISALIGSIIVFLSLPGSVVAPVAQASTGETAHPRAFIAHLPLADARRAPTKIVGAHGEESLGVKTTAPRVYVVDAQSGAMLFAKHEDEQAPPASITKLMTARVLRAHGLAWDVTVTIETTEDGGGVAYFAPGDEVTVRDLWKAMLIGSSNAAAVALARWTGLTEEKFVGEMNANAAGLGMANTHFADVTGLSPESVTTARDVSALARAAFADPEISETATTPGFMMVKSRGVSRKVTATDKLLASFVNRPPYRIMGGKTGFITESGYNIVLQISRENASPIIVVVMGSGASDLRFQEAKSVAYWTFQNWRWSAGALAKASTP
jgi:D-alanyl-D-alanine carboxypeptidase